MSRLSIDSELHATEFAEIEHRGGQHKVAEFPEVCFLCYKQKGSHEDLLARHPALKNRYGSNYPIGYIPE